MVGIADRLVVVHGDITKLEVDVIVNAANEQLLGGGGVDGAIHAAAGPELLEACQALPELRQGVRCLTGDARLTRAFRLKARYVVHTVGPVWRGGHSGEPDLLASCYRQSLTLARKQDVRSIALPCISTGLYGYPAKDAARIAVRECSSFLEQHPSFELIQLVGFSSRDVQILNEALTAALPR